ncbi:MAG: four helix bundle protein [Chitinophagales bacterium]|nr:four helix bundle protein [Chitinophagales bacterium]MCB9022099.1 four helix bundle protein [Chitinophagales bacterium]HPR29336.1 four helix bundle protein [Chitinophagales bacterium]HQU39691.1 four helix bundle protein [Chitinophagales bacterium]HQU77150.1 four helix bundle protein [Chitinophagales bacterium]
MQNFKKLEIWQQSMDVAKQVYLASDRLPNSERFGLVNQMRRAAVSVPSNIAEGSGRLTAPDFRHFLAVALSSSNELTTQVILSEMLNYLPGDLSLDLQDKLDKNQRMIYKFIQSVNRNIK